MAFSLRDFIAGWSGGICGVLVGHPGDTVKVLQQVKDGKFVDVTVTLFKQEGIHGFYKGMLFPLMMNGIQKSTFFGVYGSTLKFLQGTNKEGKKTCGQGLNVKDNWHRDVYIAGAVAGGVHGVVTCPIDIVKVRIQVRKDPNHTQSHKIRSVIKEVHSRAGWRGFYRGLGATLFRDFPGGGVYVLLYEHLLFLGCCDRGKCDCSIRRQILIGGTAGTIAWLIGTPLDVVKSRIQADDLKNPKYNGTIDCVIKSYKESGLPVFARGMLPNIIRAFPVNAAIFLGYEWFFKNLEFLEH